METAATTLPIDSVRLYGPLRFETLRKTTKFRYSYRLSDGITDRYTFTLDNGYEIKLDYRYGKAFMQFELGALVHGHNHQLLTLEQANAAILQLCIKTRLELHGFQIGRLDITKDINCSLSSARYLNLPKYFKERFLYKDGGLLLMTKPKAKNRQADRSVCIYQKGEKVRVEMRMMTTDTIKRAFCLDRPLRLSDVLTGDFVQAANNYHAGMVHQMTTDNSDHPQVISFRKAALK